MSHTPLHRLLVRTLAKLSRTDGSSPVAAAAGPARAATLRRRELLLAGGALVGAACRPARAPEPQNATVAVVGAGLAGLCCAEALTALGVDVTLLEASVRFGGRTLTDRTSFPGRRLELGGELVDTEHVVMQSLAAEFGLRLLDHREDGKLASLVGLFGNTRYDERALAEGFAPIGTSVREALRALKEPDELPTVYRPNGAQELDKLSVSAWLDSVGAKGPARELLEVAYTCEFGTDADQLGALELLTLVGAESNRLQLYGDSDERFVVADGVDSIARRLSERVGGRIIVGARVQRVKQQSDGRVTLSWERGRAARETTFDHVVLALPLSMVQQLELKLPLSPLKARLLRELRMGQNTKVGVGFQRRVWRDQGTVGELVTDRPAQSCWDGSRQLADERGVLTNFLGGTRAVEAASSDLAIEATRFIDDVETAFPGLSAARIRGEQVRMPWPTHPLARGSYAAYRVGQRTAFGGVEGEPVGRVHFCGEYTSVECQGFMEGAATSGYRAAVDVAKTLGLDAVERTTGRLRARLAHARETERVAR